MSPLAHRIYRGTLISIVVLVTLYLFYQGLPYYSTSLTERFYHPQHNWLKPSGTFGHGLGILGTLFILIGVFGYIARKRYKSLARFGRLKYWLEFHIFLCVLGPVMILFHTAFKFGGIVSVAFWSMVAVVASGVIGRFIYIQIPRTIEGRELSLGEIRQMKQSIEEVLRSQESLDEADYQKLMAATADIPAEAGGTFFGRIAGKYFEYRRTIRNVRQILRKTSMPGRERRKVIKLVKRELALNNRIERLQTMRKLFKYWHVAHLPFALIMLIIVVIHVIVTLTFGYRWIF